MGLKNVHQRRNGMLALVMYYSHIQSHIGLFKSSRIGSEFMVSHSGADNMSTSYEVYSDQVVQRTNMKLQRIS